MADVINTLIEISKAPSAAAEFDTWLRMDDAVAFLKENAVENEFIVYASTQTIFLHAVLVPSASLNPPNVEDLMAWNLNPHSSWGILVSYPEKSVSIAPPLDSTGSKTLDGGEQLVFGRSFEGRVGNEDYFEVLQKFTHVFGLHFVESRSAYCRLDKNGDLEDVIRIADVPARGAEYGGTIITFDRALLDEYMVLSDSALVRMFDVTRYRRSNFSGWSDTQKLEYTNEPDLFYRSHVESGHASYMRGCQIVRSAISKEEVRKHHDIGYSEERQYASFLAWDWKNGVVREISTAPGETANYFTESALPFETSPAFFRPEVLTKYKADSEKYRFQQRSISCRGTWHLQTYDINEAGQVHTYIVYLRNLPYEEQLYWKAFNEKPKGSISNRAFETDFRGVWNTEYDPLNSLKAGIQKWNHARVPWWTLRSEKLLDQAQYPITSSPDEWANEIMNLDQLVVEGFEIRWLRTTAKDLGRTPDSNLGSLGLVEDCLIGLDWSEEYARKIVAPLREVHNLRTKMKGHASGDEAVEIRRQILTEHGSYKKHFRWLAEQIDQSLGIIEDAFKKFSRPAQAAT